MKVSQLTKLRKKSERMVQIMGKLERWKKLTGLVCMAVLGLFACIGQPKRKSCSIIYEDNGQYYK